MDPSQKTENASDNAQATPPTTDDQKQAPSGGQIPESKKEIKKKVIKEEIGSISESFDYKEQSAESVKESQEKLRVLDEREESKLKRDSAINALESFISETRDKLDQELYQASASDEQKGNIPKELSAASEWLEYESDGADHTVLEEKLKSLKALTKELFARVKEHQDRPESLAALRNMLNITEMFYSNAINVTQEDQIFTEVELTALRKLVDDTQEWIVNGETEQALLPKSENPPKLTLRNIAEKMQTLDREVKYLLNKARLAPPKKKETKNETEKVGIC